MKKLTTHHLLVFNMVDSPQGAIQRLKPTEAKGPETMQGAEENLKSNN